VSQINFNITKIKIDNRISF